MSFFLFLFHFHFLVSFGSAMTIGVESLPEYHVSTLDEVTRETMKESSEAEHDPYIFPRKIKRLAIIGAGPAGLASAKAAKEHGLEIKVFDRASDIGGMWLYEPTPSFKPPIPCEKPMSTTAIPKEGVRMVRYECEADLKDAFRHHAPPNGCYRDLFTNTASIMMQFRDFPFKSEQPWYHLNRDIHAYFKDYAQTFGLLDSIELNTSVERVEKNEQTDKWVITTLKAETVEQASSNHQVRYTTQKDAFDAIIVASGAFQDPMLPGYPHLKEYDACFPDKIIHCKQFRKFELYKGKNVLLVGGNVSAMDVAGRLAGEAAKVYLSIRGSFQTPSKVLNLIRSLCPDSVIRLPGIHSFADKNGNVNGTITFVDGQTVADIDSVIFCTGYQCDFKYFGPLRAHVGDDDKDALVVTNGKRPVDTYRDIFLIKDPTIAFVGIPSCYASIGYFYYQAQAVARVWSGSALLPSQKRMKAFMDSYTYPFPPFDMSTHGEQLHVQRLVTWLNAHARALKKILPDLEGIDNATVDKWDEIVTSLKSRNAEIIAYTKSKVYT
ncbi:hypothetical protein BX666DRAFT_431954 [Dichotomocladium elegans]|nr:hypothetical protein BX666DRAFT_431954 [Dichotomocladium elegans]